MTAHTHTPVHTYDYTPDGSVDRLIRDLVVFTENDAFSPEEILNAYNYTVTDLNRMRADAAFLERWQHHKRNMGDGRTAVLREQARLLTESALRTLYETVNDPEVKTADKLKAFSLLAEMADVKPRNDPAALQQGVVVNLSFGSLTPHTTTAHRTIEHDDTY